jgi:hypothetical protein
LLYLLRRHQRGVFDEAAEFLLADVVMRAFPRGDVFEALVFNFQSLQMQDEQIFVALIPELLT